MQTTVAVRVIRTDILRLKCIHHNQQNTTRKGETYYRSTSSLNISGNEQSKLNLDVGIVIIQLFVEVSLLERTVLATETTAK